MSGRQQPLDFGPSEAPDNRGHQRRFGFGASVGGLVRNHPILHVPESLIGASPNAGSRALGIDGTRNSLQTAPSRHSRSPTRQRRRANSRRYFGTVRWPRGCQSQNRIVVLFRGSRQPGRRPGHTGQPIDDGAFGSRGLLSLLERVTAGRRALRSPPPVLLRRRELERWSRRASGPSCRSRRPMPRHFRTL